MDLLNDPCVRLWRRRVPSVFGNSFRVFKRWYEEDLVHDSFFGGMSPSELVDWQATHYAGREGMRLRVRLQLWVDEMDLRFSTKRRYYSGVASLFLHNHAPFPPDPSFRFTADKPPVVGRLEVGFYRKILLNCDPRYRTLFLMMGQGIMGEGELLFVNENLAGYVVDCVTRNVGVFRLDLPGRKASRNRQGFATFLSSKSDFGDACRAYLKTVDHDVRSVLFVNDYGNPITAPNIQQCFHRRALEVGVIEQITPKCSVCGGGTTRFRNHGAKGTPRDLRYKTYYRCEDGHVTWAKDVVIKGGVLRYGVNPHEIRDLMRTRWESSGAMGKVAEFMMGHVEAVDPNQYLSWMKYEKDVPVREYRKALRYLNVLSCEPSKIDKGEFEAKMAEQNAKTNAMTGRMVALERENREFRELVNNPAFQKMLRDYGKKKR